MVPGRPGRRPEERRREAASSARNSWSTGDENPVTVAQGFCPHRGVALRLGQVRDGALECPYHGWLFERAAGGVRAFPGSRRAGAGRARRYVASPGTAGGSAGRPRRAPKRCPRISPMSSVIGWITTSPRRCSP
ncbi:Rieske (2Fe-2S) protein [Streptomyces sp. NPDC002215]|uniref:Rieske (2Fe-2S) protein n=1 Tax=Streptomyces sp. NPDC002215 TaxID=3154412 RepID=UPI00333196F6